MVASALVLLVLQCLSALVPSSMQLPLAPTLAPLGEQPRAALARLSQLGFRHVQLGANQPGLRPRELDRSARRDLAATLRRHEVSASGVDLWVPTSHFFEPARADRAVAAVLEAIELAGSLGRCPVSLNLPAAEACADQGSVIETIAERAAHHGVEIADHAVGAGRWAELGVGIDPAAWLSQDKDPAAGMIAEAERLVSVRLCDLLSSGLRGPIGDPQEGRLDVLEYKVAISVCGYTRPVVVDARQWSDPWAGLEQTGEAWRGSDEVTK